MKKSNSDTANKLLIIHNPVAGTSDPETVKSILETRLADQQILYEIYRTTGEERVREIVGEAVRGGVGMVWAAGGDGTVSAVANGLQAGGGTMGIIPIGTGNSLARELGIPLKVDAAVDLLLGENTTRRLDGLKIQDDLFLLAVSIGISAKTMAETEREQKRRFGRTAYFFNGLRLLVSNSIWPFQVILDDLPYLIRASEIIAANAGIIGYKPIRWGAQVRPDDGRIDLCYVKLESVSGLLSLLRGLIFNKHEEVDELSCIPARKTIEIRSRRRLPVQADGEPLGYTPVRIKVVADVLPVIVPVESS